MNNTTDDKQAGAAPFDLSSKLELLGYGPSFQDELCNMLEEVQLLANSSRNDIEILAHYIHAYHAPGGTTILTEGGQDRMIWFLVKGELEVLKEKSEREKKRLAKIRPGKSIGEMSLIDEQPHSASVVTTRESTLLLLTRDNFFRMARAHPRQGMNLTWRLAQQLSHRLRQTSGQLLDYL
jgi:CRP-like cAMP-binding protein